VWGQPPGAAAHYNQLFRSAKLRHQLPVLSLNLCLLSRTCTPLPQHVYTQTGNSHMALLTAPEGSDLEEFKRTKAFMMTQDEDDSSSSSCSSSSSDRWGAVC
jgi:hypothetical protein